MTHNDHLNYLKTKGNFTIECSTKIFSKEELALLNEYGHWFEGLIFGYLEPLTFPQEHFIEIFKTSNPKEIKIENLDNIAEKAWWKYLNRMLLEEDYPERFNNKY